MKSIWSYDDALGKAELDVVGYDVHATDGGIGTVDEASHRAGCAYVVVDTGRWIFGSKRMIPAGVVQCVNENDHTVHVSLSKDEIELAPDFRDEDRDSRDQVYDAYYGSFARR